MKHFASGDSLDFAGKKRSFLEFCAWPFAEWRARFPMKEIPQPLAGSALREGQKLQTAECRIPIPELISATLPKSFPYRAASVPLSEKSVSDFGLANSYFCKLTFLTRLQNPPRELAGPRPQSGRSGAAGVQEPSSESRVAAGGLQEPMPGELGRPAGRAFRKL